MCGPSLEYNEVIKTNVELKIKIKIKENKVTSEAKVMKIKYGLNPKNHACN